MEILELIIYIALLLAVIAFAVKSWRWSAIWAHAICERHEKAHRQRGNADRWEDQIRQIQYSIARRETQEEGEQHAEASDGI